MHATKHNTMAPRTTNKRIFSRRILAAASCNSFAEVDLSIVLLFFLFLFGSIYCFDKSSAKLLSCLATLLFFIIGSTEFANFQAASVMFVFDHAIKHYANQLTRSRIFF